MDVRTIPTEHPEYPKELAALNRPPTIYIKGRALSDIMSRPRLAIVGSRRPTAYGKKITYDFAKYFAGQGVVIVSGLAYGVDAIAHQGALDAGGITLAVLPSPVQQPAPSGNTRLAHGILEKGGALISSYAEGSESFKANFVARNEYVAALSDIVLLTEAAIDSGSRHTAKFKLEQAGSGQVMVMPGNITSALSAGGNAILAAGHAGVATGVKSVATALGLGAQQHIAAPLGDNPQEQRLLLLLADGISDGQLLHEMSGLDVIIYNQTLTMLEISAKIRPLGGNHWALA